MRNFTSLTFLGLCAGETNVETSEFLKLYDSVSKLGFPILFVIGQLRGWWYVKPYVDMLISRISELIDELSLARLSAERATDLAESSNAIAKTSLEIAQENTRLLVESRDIAKETRLEIARLTGLLHKET